MKFYFGLNRVHGAIGHALRKYDYVGFILVLFFIPYATKELVLCLEQSVLVIDLEGVFVLIISCPPLGRQLE